MFAEPQNLQQNIAELCNGSTADSDSACWGSNPYSAANRGVAQLGGALRSGRRGRWFESSHLDHLKKAKSSGFLSFNYTIR